MPAMRGSGIVLVMNRTVRMLIAAAALAVAVTGLAACQGAGSIDKVGAASIAKALTSPYAWQRLKRFAAVISYQTLSEAAEHLASSSRHWSRRSAAWNVTSEDPSWNVQNADGP